MIKLLQTNTTDKTVEIIKAIGSSWPLVLIIFLTIFFVIYRKKIGKFLSGMKKVSGETPIGKISLERTEEIFISKGTVTDAEVIEETVTEEKEEKLDPPNSKISFTDVFLQLQKHDLDKAEKLFNQIQEDEGDAIEKEKNVLYMLYLKYSYAGINTLAELEKKFNESTHQVLKSKASKYLGGSFLEARRYADAEKWYKIALSSSVIEEEKSDLTINIANSYFESGSKQKAISFLKDSIINFVDPILKSKILKSLGDFFEKENDWVSRCLALELALENDPNNIELLFKIAYAYSDNKSSKEKLIPLSLLHYKEILVFNNESSGALNNLGVAYNELKLQAKAVNSYKKAAQLDHTLAMSNLAYKYLNAGFNEEAKSILDEAKTKDDVHENIWTALKKISVTENEENKLEEEIIRRAKQAQIFLRESAIQYFNPTLAPLLNPDGVWKVKGSIINIKQLPNPEYYDFSWTDETYKYTVSLNTKKSGASVEKGEYVKTGAGNIEKLTAFVLLSELQIKLMLYNNDESKYMFYEIIKE